MQMLLEAIKINPIILQNPAVTAKIIRMIGQGNPEMEGIADLIAPSNDQEMTPQQMHQALQMAQAQSQQQQQTIQKLAQALAEKMPEIQAKERQNVRDNLTRIVTTQITASKDTDIAAADREAAQLEKMLGMSHDAATQAVDHEHADSQQAADQQHQQQMPAVTAAAQPEPQGEEGA